MLVFCLLRIVLGCLSSTDPFQIASAETVADKIDRRPLALQDEDNPKRHEDPTLGNDYLLAVTGQHNYCKGTIILVSCATDTTINVFAPYVNMTETHHISSGTQMIPLDDRLMNGKNTLAKKGVHVTADRPIAIYVIESYRHHLLQYMDGYFALPISVLSTEYIVVTDTYPLYTMCQFVIAALEYKTIVNVTFKTTGKINISDTNYSSGDVFSLEMSTLDTFQVQHEYDLTGTFIQSNKPIAVFSGCVCGFGRKGGACQHEVEQIIPVSSLGQEYITLPLIGAASYRYRIIAPFNNTIASIQGQNFTIESGTFLENWDTEPIYIQASKPVMVMEYGQSTSTSTGYIIGSDPSMITIPAISTFSVNVTFGLHTILTGNNIQYYLYVTVKTDVANKLMLDHKMLNLEVSYAVKTDIWGNYTILVTKIASGYHKLHHPDTSVRYGAVLYGTGFMASIGFPLGYNTDPPKPSVIFVSTHTQSIKLIIAIVDGRAKGYKIMAASINVDSTYTQKWTFLPNKTTSIYNFTTTDLPGTSFSFRVVANSGSEQGAGYSDPVIEPNVCYAPSKPSITFVPTDTQNIKLNIGIVHGQATGYEIMVVSNTSGNTYTEKGTFLPNETTSVYNFTTTDLPGTCFSFRVVATSGSGQWAGYSDPVFEPNVCYAPSKPSITFFPTGTQNIKLRIVIVHGQATGYEIMVVSNTSGSTYTEKGTFLPNKTTSAYNFTTTDLPGSCFSFRVVATSGSGHGASYSDPVIEPNVCYAPSKPSITFVPTDTQNIKLSIGIVHGQATGYEIMVVSDTSGNTYTEKGTFVRNETTSVYNFTTTDLPGSSFSFRVVATSGSGQWAGYSDPVIEPNVCYAPSKPSITFFPTGTQNIKLRIVIVHGQATGYEIMVVSNTSGSTYTEKGTFLPNKTTSAYNFTTTDLPGSCFSFRVVATSGSGHGASYSDPVIEPNVCYAPFKPSITFFPTDTQNIKLRIVIVHGQATGYEIMVVSNTTGITYTEKGTFLPNETTSVYSFTTTDLPGSCFSFRVVATSSSGQGAGHSDPVIEPNVCFGKESTVDLTILFAAIGVLTSLLVIIVLLNVHFIRKSRRIQIPPLENLQSANPVPPEEKAVTYENISPADNTRNMPEHLHLRFILPSDEQDGYLTPKISGMHHEYEYIESI